MMDGRQNESTALYVDSPRWLSEPYKNKPPSQVIELELKIKVKS
jgi:hypothetical protein